MGFQHQCEASGRRGDATLGQEPSQSVQSPLNPHAGRILSDAQVRTDFRIAATLEAPQEHRLAFTVVQRVHRLVQQRAKSVPIRLRARVEVGEVHGEGGLFSLGPAGFGSAVGGGGMPYGRVEPTGQGGMLLQLRGFAGQVDEDCLCDVLSRLRVWAGLSQRRRVDEIDMPAQQLFERRLIGFPSKSPEEFLI